MRSWRAPPDRAFAQLVLDGEIVCDPRVVAELTLGGLRATQVELLMELELLPVASYEATMTFIRTYHPKGVGWFDVNLLVTAPSAGATILTADNGLKKNAEMHGAAYVPG